MTKIMLVEDDNNLREIYQARLLAEGYEIVSAKDGEEALALAVKEKPDLIIADIMMPKISGFDMLDILRTTPETKNSKVIMMTALSQAEDKARADKLGADRYLVKSQVTLEDVAKVARDVLEGNNTPAVTVPGTNPITTASPTTTATPTLAEPKPEPAGNPPLEPPVTPAPVGPGTPAEEPPAAMPPAPQIAQPASLTSVPPTNTAPAASAPVKIAVTSVPPTDEPAKVDSKIQDFINAPAEAQPIPTPIPTPTPVPAPTAPAAPSPPEVSSHTRVIQPINNLSVKSPDLGALMAEEERKAAVSAPATNTVITPSGGTLPPPVVVSPSDPSTPSTTPGSVVHPSNDPNSIAL